MALSIMKSKGRAKPQEHHEGDPVYHQFETIEQQQESYVVGMWTFLVTEVMFFGALFFAYTLYRWKFQHEFYLVHKELNVLMGGTNTVVLLISSFFMAMAVWAAQTRKKMLQLGYLTLVQLCAATFLVIKFFEYSAKIDHHLVPGANFIWHGEGVREGVAQMFFSLYFTMTGLHGIHVLIGMIVIGILMYLVATDHKLITDYIPTELIGLYWHFVDLVWIFLFPLYYLIPKS